VLVIARKSAFLSLHHPFTLFNPDHSPRDLLPWPAFLFALFLASILAVILFTVDDLTSRSVNVWAAHLSDGRAADGSGTGIWAATFCRRASTVLPLATESGREYCFTSDRALANDLHRELGISRNVTEWCGDTRKVLERKSLDNGRE
jgi:hypothetical protein